MRGPRQAGILCQAALRRKDALIDGQRLAELMIEHGIGVAQEHAYLVKKINSDYFEEN